MNDRDTFRDLLGFGRSSTDARWSRAKPPLELRRLIDTRHCAGVTPPVRPVRTLAGSVAIGDAGVVEAGERMLLWCEGGPLMARATTFPPPLEVEVDVGMYVLVDDGPVETWHYEYVDDQPA